MNKKILFYVLVFTLIPQYIYGYTYDRVKYLLNEIGEKNIKKYNVETNKTEWIRQYGIRLEKRNPDFDFGQMAYDQKLDSYCSYLKRIRRKSRLAKAESRKPKQKPWSHWESGNDKEAPPIIDKAELEKHDKQATEGYYENFKSESRTYYESLSEKKRESEFKKYLGKIKKKLSLIKNEFAGEKKKYYLRGLIIDQNGVVVTNAKVTMALFQRNLIGITFYRLQEYDEYFDVYTDSNGYFVVDGKVGNSIGVHNVEAPGYRFISREFRKGHNIPLRKRNYKLEEEKKALVYIVWKEPYEPERLINTEYGSKSLPIDNKTYAFNVFKYYSPLSRKLPIITNRNDKIDADILFTPFCDTQKNNKAFLRIEAVGGGVRAADLFPFIAPTNGYKKFIDLPLKQRYTKTNLFILSRNEKVYTIAYINIELQTPEDEEPYLYLDVGNLSNPAKSPNLQPWGARYSNRKKLLERDWSRDIFDDFKDRLEERQKPLIRTLEQKLLRQIKLEGKYHRGFLGSDKKFYKYNEPGRTNLFPRLPVFKFSLFRRFKTRITDIAPLKRMGYSEGIYDKKSPFYNKYLVFVLEKEKTVLVFSGFRKMKWKECYSESKYIKPPNRNIRYLRDEGYKLVEIKEITN